jgi:hypothetical protein
VIGDGGAENAVKDAKYFRRRRSHRFEMLASEKFPKKNRCARKNKILSWRVAAHGIALARLHFEAEEHHR